MSRDQKWTRENFSRIVKKYGGKYIAVHNKRIIGAAKTPKELIIIFKIPHPEKVYFFKVPREEELICLL